MSELITLWEKPQISEIYMIAGWRQWADGGAVSSGLPRFLIDETNARKIGEINPDGYYLFQLPGAQQFLRPIVRHNDGVTDGLQTMSNDLYYTEVSGKGVVIFLGDEPHLDAERYARAFLEVVSELNIRQIVQLGGVFAQVPYDRQRHIHGILSLPHLRATLEEISAIPSNYQGPSSIGSYLSKRAGEQGVESIGLYAFCPIFQFGGFEDNNKNILIEKDFVAWLNVMERINHLFAIQFDLSTLETLADDLVDRVDEQVSSLDAKFPELRLTNFFDRLRNSFEEESFTPLDDVWEDSLRKLGDQFFPNNDEEG
jgi:predicted ATP-grasp superfamily ATP-dependent carboligase